MRQKRTLTIYVEGGGDYRKLLQDCRQAFSKFFEEAGLPSRSFSVEACGSRQDAYDDFCTALAAGENAILLVDSEELVNFDRQTNLPIQAWQHLAERPNDAWKRPAGSTDLQAHLMVPTMEAWFLADKEKLASYYRGKYNRGAFNENPLPKRADVEQVSKDDLNDALKAATKGNDIKGVYNKGNHSFDILATLDPKKVAAASYHAKRLLCYLKNVLKANATMQWLDCTDFAT